jgi:hypothetical protein
MDGAQYGLGIPQPKRKAASPAFHPLRKSVYLKSLAQRFLGQNGVVRMRETPLIGTSLDLASACALEDL